MSWSNGDIKSILSNDDMIRYTGGSKTDDQLGAGIQDKFQRKIAKAVQTLYEDILDGRFYGWETETSNNILCDCEASIYLGYLSLNLIASLLLRALVLFDIVGFHNKPLPCSAVSGKVR